MLTNAFDIEHADITIIVTFPILPIRGEFQMELGDWLLESVWKERGGVQEHVYAGDDYVSRSNVVDCVRYQFGDLYTAEYDSEEVATSVERALIGWVNSKGGYEKVAFTNGVNS
jgi:hypothetical protein